MSNHVPEDAREVRRRERRKAEYDAKQEMRNRAQSLGRGDVASSLDSSLKELSLQLRKIG